jgi:hypothetical protein
VSSFKSNVGIFSATHLAGIQKDMEERLSKRLKVKSVREDILSGFVAMRPMSAATRRQIEIFIRVMGVNEKAGQLKMGDVSDQTPLVWKLVGEAEDLQEEFLKLEAQG